MMRVIYEKHETCEVARGYNYTMDTAKEWKADGWILTGTYYHFLIFRRDF